MALEGAPALERSCYLALATEVLDAVRVQRVQLTTARPLSDPSTVVALAPQIALSCARTGGVPLFERRPPAHSVLIGRCRLEVDGTLLRTSAIAIPAHTPHRIVDYGDPFAAVAYLDPRHYSFDDAQRLAEAWRGFVPGHDDLRDALGDALESPRRRVDGRVLQALDLMEHGSISVAEAAARVDLSGSRLTHLMSETLGAPPRVWQTWFKLRAALGHALLGQANLTEAAHLAGFADSAHFTRSCKRLMGVRPAMMLPQTVYLAAPTERGVT